MDILSGTNLVTIASGGVASSGFLVYGGTLVVGGGYTRTTGGGYAATKNGSLIITNGVVNLNTVNELLNAYAGTGNTTVSDSGTLELGTLRISQAGGSPDANIVNVNTGGTIRLHRFYVDEKTTSRGRVNLNGGTLVAKSSRSDFMLATHSNYPAYISFMVREGGAVIDSNGFNIECRQELYSGAASDGGVTKKGTGTFILNHTNTYTGVTSVEGGTLVLGVNNTLLPDNTVLVSSNAVLNVNNTSQALAGIGGSGTVSGNSGLTVTGTVAPGDAGSFGTLTLAASCPLSGTLSVDVGSDGSGDRLHVQGDLDLSNLALDVVDPGLLAKYKRYTVASCTETLSGNFTAVDLPSPWYVTYSPASKEVQLVYNAGTLILVK
jgi:autotransporter-associated beta strand protein